MAQISDGLRLPIGDASSVVRRYRDHADRRAACGRRRSCAARWSAGPARSTAATSAAGCPRTSTGGHLPGWTWADVLPHFLAHRDRPRLRRAAARCRRPDARSAGSPNSTVAQRAFVDAATRDAAIAGSTTSTARRRQAVPRCRRGAAEHRRRHPGRPGRRLPRPGAGRPNLTRARRTPRVRGIRFAGGRAVGVECVGPGGPTTLTADRIVLCAGAIGSAHLLMLSGVGPAAVLRGCGNPCRAGPAGRGRARADHPEWVLPVDWPAAPGRPPLEAVLTTVGRPGDPVLHDGFRRDDGGRGDDPADRPHLGVDADAARGPRQGDAGVRGPGRGTA